MIASTVTPDFGLINPHAIARLRKTLSRLRVRKKLLPTHIASLLGQLDEDEEIGSAAWMRRYMQRASASIAARYPALTIIHHLKIPKPRFVERTAAIVQERTSQGQKTAASKTIINANAKTPLTAGKGVADTAFSSACDWLFAPSLGRDSQQAGGETNGERKSTDMTHK